MGEAKGQSLEKCVLLRTSKLQVFSLTSQDCGVQAGSPGRVVEPALSFP